MCPKYDGPGAVGRAAAADRFVELHAVPNIRTSRKAPGRWQAAALHVQRQRRATALHCLGESAAFERIDERLRHHSEISDDLDDRLQRYGALNPELLHATGNDRVPPVPVHSVGSAG